MSQRISDDRLQQLRYHWQQSFVQFDLDTAECLAELQRSRALEKQLRALAERMRERYADDDGYSISAERLGKEIATREWLASLDSLLTAHGSAQPEAKS